MVVVENEFRVCREIQRRARCRPRVFGASHSARKLGEENETIHFPTSALCPAFAPRGIHRGADVKVELVALRP